MGRRKVINEKNLIKAAIGSGGIITHMAKNLHVARGSLMAWAGRKPENRKLVDELILEHREAMIDTAEGNLFRSLKEGSEWSTKYALSTIGKHRGYVQKQEVEQIGRPEPVQINVIMPTQPKQALTDKTDIVDIKPKEKEENSESNI